ncbi:MULTISPECIES: glucose PTS transporter transcription antiterminator GlcT [Heyndrickxia]|jgi:transcriptional antiterminator|uniref:Transcription antiterminator n=2 Tax=Heyndrickxia coagulans TaxID=1398 RepID=A0AAW7CE97_HEYCO|nr:MULTISPECIES: transcription antiterminator [Heyndrickxia]AJH79032.1 ptsGHI operon antiterminator [Heyndrickxia coagulans DSM 1 = ATCC 7050]MCI1576020.1 transcription antiterminator [Heyndrickxia coagulans]MCR2847773.1 transcription antiterminator [Heyndrickxia coagulans]MDL5041824.1 transcription antiterminator [Heyndrickxia coagulans]MDR4225422.1 transcription antiterminator [Heyndrickxia coagulans DSM 1 = ATCC 7050]
MEAFIVKKVLNNNVLVASHPRYEETVLIGKGIGFNRKKGEAIPQASAEKMFVLKNETEQEQYMKLIPSIDNQTLEVVISAIEMIRSRADSPLNEHIHVALTDHIAFAINRIRKGLAVKNPFVAETKILYPREYEIAREVVDYINEATDVYLPEGEAGFIALHIHSAVTDKQLSELSRHSHLIGQLISTVEHEFKMTFDKDSIHYMRLVRHLRYTIDRVLTGEKVEEPEKLNHFLQQEYPRCYNLSWKLIKIMQQALQKPVYDAEAVYLTMHLQRIQSKIES